MTNAELAILSLVAEQPRHGYEIEHIIEERGMREWTEIGFSSIYYLLNKLDKADLVQSQLQHAQGRGPARKIYSLTEAGRQALIEGTVKALATPQQASIPFLVGLANFPMIPEEQVLESLNTYAGQLEEKIEHLSQRVEEQRPLPSFVEAMFEYSRTMAKAELNWMQYFIKEVEAGDVKS